MSALVMSASAVRKLRCVLYLSPSKSGLATLVAMKTKVPGPDVNSAILSADERVITCGVGEGIGVEEAVGVAFNSGAISVCALAKVVVQSSARVTAKG